MNLYTVGFAQKSAQTFFTLLKDNGVVRLLDVRLNNTSQLAGFAKKEDLAYFLREIAGVAYEHRLEFAPTEELMNGWKGKKMAWEDFRQEYRRLLRERGAVESLGPAGPAEPTVLLCSEPKPTRCHRSLAAEALAERFPGLVVRHL